MFTMLKINKNNIVLHFKSDPLVLLHYENNYLRKLQHEPFEQVTTWTVNKQAKKREKKREGNQYPGWVSLKAFAHFSLGQFTVHRIHDGLNFRVLALWRGLGGSGWSGGGFGGYGWGLCRSGWGLAGGAWWGLGSTGAWGRCSRPCSWHLSRRPEVIVAVLFPVILAHIWARTIVVIFELCK